MSDHAYLSPSGSSKWLKCPISLRLSEGVAEAAENDAADEGTLAHEIGETLILAYTGQVPRDVAKTRITSLAMNKHYTRAMLGYMEEYATFVIERYHMVKAKDVTAKLIIEQRVDVGAYVPGGFGRVDNQILSKKSLTIIDLKYGKGVAVSADWNTQIMIYALGALLASPHDIEIVIMIIYQPRMDSITEFTMSSDELLTWAEQVLRPAAVKAWHGVGKATPGPHCRFCKAKPFCRANADYLQKTINFMLKPIDTLTPAELADIIDRTDEVKRWLSAIDAHAIKMLEEGKQLPRYKLARSAGRRTITDAAKAAQILRVDGGLKTDEIYKPRELNTLGDLEAITGKKVFAELMKEVIKKPEGKPELARIEDKRPALDRNAEAANAFKNHLAD